MILRSGSLRRLCLALSLFSMALLLAGCGGEDAPVTAEKSKFEVAGSEEGASNGPETETTGKSSFSKLNRKAGGAETAAAETPGETTPNPSGDGPSSRYPLPEGDNEQLKNFILGLDAPPKGRTRREQAEDYLARGESQLAAIRKLLAEDLKSEEKQELVQKAQMVLLGFAQNGVPEAQDRLDGFAKELASSKDPVLALQGRIQQFLMNTMKIIGSQPENGKEILATLDTFLTAEKGAPETFEAAAQICAILQQASRESPENFGADFVTSLRLVGTAFKGNKDETISRNAQNLLDLAKVNEADAAIGPKLVAVADGKEGAEEAFLEAVKKLLADQKPNEILFGSLQKKMQFLELQLGKYETALKLNDLAGEAFKDLEDKEIQKTITRSIEFARKRLGLIGKPFAPEGVTPDGKPFDFAPYKDKVVLVDFWATWCRPCLEELPNVKKNYEGYHAKGFEVVGVSLDSEMEALSRFLSFNDIPWQTVISQELFDAKTVENGFAANTSAVACGIEAIPFVMLIGKDGNVDSIHVRGERLENRLKELLGDPAPEKPAEEKTEEKKPAEKTKPAETKSEEPAKAAEEKSAEEKPAEKSADPAKEEDGGGCGVEPPEKESKNAEAPAEDESKVNPYSAKPGLSTDKLVAYIEKMLDKPKTIQGRPGFAEAVVEACDRVMTAAPAPKETEYFIAAEAKFETLHKKACTGDEACDKTLMAFVEQVKADERPRIARQVAFFLQERKVLDGAELPAEKIPDLLKELRDYFAAEKLTARHLRMASSTVALINRLEDGDEREKQFAEFGGLFAKASDKELARYGKKLAQKPEAEESDLVGKPMELSGQTAVGNDFKWDEYRGKVVLVDFWATWCGPCRKEMPHVKELYEKLHPQGFEIVGVSVDKDLEALAAYLEENKIPWQTLAGEETQELAQKYGVRGIPTMMAVDKQGKILGVAHNVASLTPIIEKALKGDAAERGEKGKRGEKGESPNTSN